MTAIGLSNGARGLNELLEGRKGWLIEEIDIVRRPLPKILATVSNFLNTKKHDQIFHLYQQIVLKDPVTGRTERINFEKNETINTIRNVEKTEPLEDRVKVDLGGRKISIDEYLNNGKKAVTRAGKSYMNYSLRTNNCQDWTILHLRGNALGNALNNQEAVDFISQNAQQLLPSWLGRITEYLTTGARKLGEVIGVSK